MADLDLADYSILLVDDVPFVRETVTRLLKGMGGPTVHQADDGAKALTLLKSGKSMDFVIADFNMPVFNGLQLLKAVRTGDAGVDRAFPFAILTGFSDKHLVDMALALDVNAFLLKPVSKKALSQRLHKMLKRGGRDVWLKSTDSYRDVPIEEAEDINLPVPKTRAEQARAEPAAAEEAAPETGPFELDPRQLGIGKNVMRRLSSLSGKFQDSDLAQNIGRSVDVLISTSGERAASRIVSYLDGMVKRGIVELDDLPDILSYNAA